MSIFTSSFLKASAERAVKTFAQSLIALFAVGQADILSVDWNAGLAVAGTAVVLSFLTSVASSGVGPTGSPSLVEFESRSESEPAV